MLVLKRKIGESIMIGDEIEVVLLEKEGDTIKIGIEAPRVIRVFRKEIYEEIKAANRSAMQVPGLEELRKLFGQGLKKEGNE